MWKSYFSLKRIKMLIYNFCLNRSISCKIASFKNNAKNLAFFWGFVKINGI